MLSPRWHVTVSGPCILREVGRTCSLRTAVIPFCWDGSRVGPASPKKQLLISGNPDVLLLLLFACIKRYQSTMSRLTPINS